MRACLKAFLAMAVVAALASPAMAQGGRGGFGGGQGGANLLSNPSVQKELKLDATQIEKAQAVATKAREKSMALREQLQDLEPEERMKKSAELMKPITDEAMTSAAAFLKPEQLTRFKQVEIQARGANAFTDSTITKKLNATPEQVEKVKTLLADSNAEMREIFQSAGDDRQAAMAKITTLRKETLTKILALMSAEQKATWTEMIGTPFEVVPQAPRGN